MSSGVIAASTTEDLIAGFRDKRFTRNQVIAALTVAGATAAGAVMLVQAVENSSSTPPATPVVAHHSGNTLSGISATNQTALHQRHIALQGAGH
jgi:cation transporter-like permease